MLLVPLCLHLTPTDFFTESADEFARSTTQSLYPSHDFPTSIERLILSLRQEVHQPVNAKLTKASYLCALVSHLGKKSYLLGSATRGPTSKSETLHSYCCCCYLSFFSYCYLLHQACHKFVRCDKPVFSNQQVPLAVGSLYLGICMQVRVSLSKWF